MNKGNIILFSALALLTAILLSSSVVVPTLHEQQSVQAASMRNDLVYSGPRASMALSGNNIYLTWWDNKTGNNEVYFAGSTDNGKTFGEPINLSNAKGASADSQIAAAQNNSVYITWWDNKTGSWEVLSRASTDNGKTFGDAVMLKSIGSSPVKTLKAPLPTTISVDTIAAASGTNEYVVWWDNTTGNWEVLFAKSTDNGKTFGNPINISNSPDARSVGARMAAQGNNVYISWMDIKPGEKHAMFRASSDNGQTFGNPIMMNITAAGNTTTTTTAAAAAG
jgi:hypothetical protein